MDTVASVAYSVSKPTRLNNQELPTNAIAVSSSQSHASLFAVLKCEGLTAICERS